MPDQRSRSVKLPEAPCLMQREGWLPQETMHPMPGAQQGPGTQQAPRQRLLCEPMMELAQTSHTKSHTQQSHIYTKDSTFRGPLELQGISLSVLGQKEQRTTQGGWADEACVRTDVALAGTGQQAAGASQSPLVSCP